METGNFEKDLRSGVSSFRLPGFEISTKALFVIAAKLLLVKWKKITLYWTSFLPFKREGPTRRWQGYFLERKTPSCRMTLKFSD